jgi:hypothetical protein
MGEGRPRGIFPQVLFRRDPEREAMDEGGVRKIGDVSGGRARGWRVTRDLFEMVFCASTVASGRAPSNLYRRLLFRDR